jgi:hypothetical protein
LQLQFVPGATPGELRLNQQHVGHYERKILRSGGKLIVSSPAGPNMAFNLDDSIH